LNNQHGVSLRPASLSDGDFLRRLFASTRERELAHLPGGAAMQALFINGQFKAQHDSYLRSFPQANHEIIEVDGAAAGRLYVDRTPRAMHLIDITLLPEYRGRGIGSALLQALLAEAVQTGSAVRLSVEQCNPAQRLYRRLGFKTVGTDGVYLFQMFGS